MSSDVIIKVEGISKCYEIYTEPRDRLKQLVFPILQRMIGIQQKKYFKDFWALRDVSFEIKKGETLGIIGKNGSGKSTLLQIICGTLKPTSGKITSNGRIAALLELGSGFNPEFTGKENIYLNATILGLTPKDIEERYEEIIAFADIGDFINQPVKTYSSGMMVRLAFAVVAHVDADILVIDEALAVGDAVFTQKCMRFINKFKKENALIFVSHDSQAITNVCSKVVWLGNGMLKKSGDTLGVVNAYHQEIINSIKNEEIQSLDSANIQTKRLTHTSLIVNEEDWSKDLILKNQLNPKRDEAGKGHVLIDAAYIETEGGSSIFSGGERTSVNYLLRTKKKIDGLLIGFTLKDRLGQKIFEENLEEFVRDNSWIVEGPSTVGISLEFDMPHLRSGIYMLDLAVAEGTQQQHIQHCWIYEALQVTVVSKGDMDSIFQAGIKKFNYWIKNE